MGVDTGMAITSDYPQYWDGHEHLMSHDTGLAKGTPVHP
jgi:hypothetical protein